MPATNTVCFRECRTNQTTAIIEIIFFAFTHLRCDTVALRTEDRPCERGGVMTVSDREASSIAHTNRKGGISVYSRERGQWENQGCLGAVGHKDSVPLLWIAAVWCLLVAPSLLLSLLIALSWSLIFSLYSSSHTCFVCQTLVAVGNLPSYHCLILFLSLSVSHIFISDREDDHCARKPISPNFISSQSTALSVCPLFKSSHLSAMKTVTTKYKLMLQWRSTKQSKQLPVHIWRSFVK